jgi:hypothetical protein
MHSILGHTNPILHVTDGITTRHEERRHAPPKTNPEHLTPHLQNLSGHKPAPVNVVAKCIPALKEQFWGEANGTPANVTHSSNCKGSHGCNIRPKDPDIAETSVGRDLNSGQVCDVLVPVPTYCTCTFHQEALFCRSQVHKSRCPN